MPSARPYLAAFRARFQVMLQYRTAALVGFATQCWWGAIRIMVFAAFYGVHAAAAPFAPCRRQFTEANSKPCAQASAARASFEAKCL